ncbi:GH36-type glycosyl hydrolase domain-containing protein [Limoniibacter endophyticus]|uniref:Protein ndvB n=1 Tax=Limoniibacter endophyticus TaxID=1565040 RepID=A0A8J3GHH3_9HYPH|nr:glucoamylase family protein [Limoniibacter endophyticus]GHC75015.1 protein ndvB [Limoniibacter endophyticus]
MNALEKPENLPTSLLPLPASAESPIRSNFLHEDELVALGESLAANAIDNWQGLTLFDFQARNQENGEKILTVYNEINQAVANDEAITPAAQWLLDNYYVIEETIYQVKRDLPRRFYRELPVLDIEPGKSVPRVLALAWLYVAHTDSSVSGATFRAIVDGYQKTKPLRIGEIWALPSMLRFVLIENLRRLALRVNRTRLLRQTANKVADRLLSAESEEQIHAILAPYATHASDSTFSTQMLYRLRDGAQYSAAALTWLEAEFERNNTDAEKVTSREHATLSGGNVTMSNIVRGMRHINDVQWTDWFEEVSQVDRLLREQTNFAKLDFHSRDQYRSEIEELARGSGKTEDEVTRATLDLLQRKELAPQPREAVGARSSENDVGFYLLGSRRAELEKHVGYKPTFGHRVKRSFGRMGWAGIAVPVLLFTAILTWMAGAALASLGLSAAAIAVMLFFFMLPAADAAVSFYNTVVMQFIKPTRLVGFEYKEGIPAEARTLVVVPTLIGSREDVEESIRNIEIHYLSNATGDVRFAILSDWPDSNLEEKEADRRVLNYAREEIARLNARYPMEGSPRFHMLHRRRLYNEAQGAWMGWERKRGKLHELNLLLRGEKDTTFMPLDNPLPEDVVYVVTLDADTRMMRETVTQLVGKLAHPLNRPVIMPKTGRVVAGYTILQPRVTPSLTTGDEASFFQHVSSSNRGLDPYVFAVSDLYQDVYGEGTFTGKGAYHVDAFESAIGDHIPENAILSHDLLEGALARAALVTDVEVVEDYPTRYAVDAARHHRWARGDWQLLPFIFNPKLPISGISRWKMIDNLRRSLTPIFWILSSVAGWAFLDFTNAVQWQALLIISLFMAPTFDIFNSILPKSNDATLRGHFRALGKDVAFGTAQVALKMMVLADQAWMMGDAVVRTLHRLYSSRKQMLEWHAASQASKSAARTIPAHYRIMRGALIIAVLGPLPALLSGSSGVWLALIFSAFWLCSPAFAYFISRSAETEERLELDPEDRLRLRRIARRTWRYYEDFTTEEHHFLPPDNFQEDPTPQVGARTSPTNIGMYFLSVVSARDFGWIGLEETIRRVDQTLTTIEKMERFRGHLYNWYGTRDLAPLQPTYISAVDSGNLAGHLVTLSSALTEWAESPAVALHGDLEGIIDAVSILEEMLGALPDDRRQMRPLRKRLSDRIEGTRRAVATIQDEPEMASVRTINLAVISADLVKLAQAIHTEAQSSESEDVLAWAKLVAKTCEAHMSDTLTDQDNLVALRRQLESLAQRSRQYAFEMDFSFLLREERKLLSIGYRVVEQQLDESCYDLLASEARLTSLFGVAKGDLPTEHWFRLGRPIVEIGSRGALMSWSGSMFEYLMPPLVMKEPSGGLLNQTNNLIIDRQRAYGRERDVPWGISEAAFNARDREMTYQYTNFGVPGLGLKRGLAQNLVIAPYASIMSAMFQPREAIDNLTKLRAIGALGRYGYYDAVDFTPRRVPEGDRRVVVKNYYAHHHGMSIVAIDNAIFEGRMRDRFHRDPVIEAAELLLQEKAPRNIPVAVVRADTAEPVKQADIEATPDMRITRDPDRSLRSTVIMSNGRYSLMLSATGTGFSRWNDLALTRWQPDPTLDTLGSFIFLSDPQTGEWWSATAEPRRAPDEQVVTYFSDDKATFVKAAGGLRSEVECIVTSECDGEGRKVTVWNDSNTDRVIDITSYSEVVLGQEAADNAHPAFSKMFVETEIALDRHAIYAQRRKRSASEPDAHMLHFLSADIDAAGMTSAETGRHAFIGRGRDLGTAAAFDKGTVLSGRSGFMMDPVMSLRRRVRIPARRKVQITFWTIAGPDRAHLNKAMKHLMHRESFARESMLAWTRSQVQTRYLNLSLAEAANVQRLARYLLYPDASLRQPGQSISAGLGSQARLWPMAISGDFPIFAIRISDQADLEVVAEALRYQEYMRTHGLLADLVIINEQASSYIQDLQHAIEHLCENARLRGHELGPRQHIFTVRRDLMDEESHRTLLAAARVVMHASNGRIFDQLDRAEITERQRYNIVPPVIDANVEGAVEETARKPALPKRSITKLPAPAEISHDDLDYWNGYGGFTKDGREYVVRLTGSTATPQPWINVIANSNFGFHTSSEGASFTWSQNSRDFQITPWTNDAVVNRAGEAIYVANLADGSVLAPYACVARRPDAVYEARHGQGYSRFSANRDGLGLEMTQLVDPQAPVKISRLKIRNGGSKTLKLRVFAYAEWVLGNSRAKTSPFIVPEWAEQEGVLLANNPYSLEFPHRTAFMAFDTVADGVGSDRREFLGAPGNVSVPKLAHTGEPLSGNVAAGDDPCGVLSKDITLKPGEEGVVLWLMGDAGSREEAVDLAVAHRAVDFDKRLSDTKKEWNAFLETLQVNTPDKAFNAMVNYWLPYQALACRIRARAAFYQASGAFGFRDQLQDTLSLLMHDPSLARAQIINATSRQFPEGDVQHWWLPGTGAGVRTMISDDVVWLAYGIHRYVSVTGDYALLDEELPFITGRSLEDGEHDAFFQPEKGASATVYEHALRGLDLALKRRSERGLSLILGGDWNDGMNRVGEAGKGESIWLSWFLVSTLRDFAIICEKRGDKATAARFRKEAGAIANAIEEHGWDGEWYRRGTFDNGQPLGSSQSDECQIDSIAQSWSILSKAGDPERAARAMDSARAHLVDEKAGVIKLFTPAFSKSPNEPGYIKSYPPGVRENGGQYTHAATWFVIALAQMGRFDAAWKAFETLNPVNHALSQKAADHYRVEPYVVAADVYGVGEKSGRGGWTWYTGSAGWLYRAAVEGILGIEREGSILHVNPRIPSAWSGFSAQIVIDEVKLEVTVERKTVVSKKSIIIDGRSVPAIDLDKLPSASKILVAIPMSESA